VQPAQDRHRDESAHHRHEIARLAAARLGEHPHEENSQKRAVGVPKDTEHNWNHPRMQHDIYVPSGKMRLDPCTDRRPDAARASSRRLAGRHGRHWFLRRRELIVQLAIAHRSDQNIDDEGDLIERRDGDCVLALLELNRFRP